MTSLKDSWSPMRSLCCLRCHKHSAFTPSSFPGQRLEESGPGATPVMRVVRVAHRHRGGGTRWPPAFFSGKPNLQDLHPNCKRRRQALTPGASRRGKRRVSPGPSSGRGYSRGQVRNPRAGLSKADFLERRAARGKAEKGGTKTVSCKMQLRSLNFGMAHPKA